MTRLERFGQLLKQEISEIIRREVSDPRIGFVSITNVKASADLKEAKIYFSVLGDISKRKSAAAGLSSATKFIRGKLARILETRSVPTLRFIYDDSLEKGNQVLDIIAKLKNEKKAF